MKKDKKYFMERLSCGISRMKRDNSVEKLRGPRTIAIKKKVPTEAVRPSNVTYEEMLPGTPDEEDLFSLEFSPTDTPSPSKKISDEMQRVDADEEHVTSFSKSRSTDHLTLKKTVSSSSLGNTDSSLNEEQYSPSHHREEENSNKTADKMVGVRSPNLTFDSADNAQRPLNETDNQDQDWIVWQTHEESMTRGGLTGWHPEEAWESSTCSVCKNIRPRIGWQKDFSHAELQAATKGGFSAEASLSEGGFGYVFEGKLTDGLKIAIKQLKEGSLQGEKEFRTEVDILSKARHRNVVMLLGSCSEGSHRMLVYEYVCNGSLDQHISRNSHHPLSWTDRVKIALGTARGLNYLHKNNIIHRDMRPDNILVNHDLEPLLGDFGLARTQSEESDGASDNRVVGTLGYLAPEYAESGKVTTKADVYSFGVILLELITGIRTTDNNLGEKSLVGWARPLLKERKYPDLIDNRIEDAHDVHQLFGMVQLAEKCLTEDPEKRLSMDKVVNTLICISNGETVSSIVGLSPANSDSFSSIPESNESQGDEVMMEQNNHNTNRHSVSSTSQRSGLFSPESSAYTYSSKSSSSSTSSKKSIFSRQKSKNHKKEAVKPRPRYQVPYGEMLS